MDVIEVITADHDEAVQLIDELERCVTDDEGTTDAMLLAVRLAISIKTHQRAEERVLYEVLRTTPGLAEVALEGPYAHQLIDVLLDKLIVQRPGREMRAILHVLRHELEYHARVEEEGHVLPAVRAVLSDTERLQLGLDLLAEKRRVRPQITRLVGPPIRSLHGGLHVHQALRARH